MANFRVSNVTHPLIYWWESAIFVEQMCHVVLIQTHPRSCSWCPIVHAVQCVWSFFAFLIFAFSTFAPALEAVHGGSQEEAGHDGSHGHRDARKDDYEEVCEGQGDLTFPETVLGELTERHTAAIGGQRALHTIYT